MVKNRKKEIREGKIAYFPSRPTTANSFNPRGAKNKKQSIQKKKAAPAVDYPVEDGRYDTHSNPKKGLSLFAKLFAFTAIVLALITIIVLLPAFRLEHVEIKGNNYVSSEAIYRELNFKQDRHAFLDLGPSLKNIVLMRYGKIEAHLLETFPEISSVKANFSWPSGIKIQVEEGIETACIRSGLEFALIDSSGKVLRLVDSAPDYLPVLEDFGGLELLVPGRQLDEDEMKILETCTEITAQLILSDKVHPDSQALAILTKSIQPLKNGYANLILQFEDETVWRVKISNGRSLADDVKKLHELIDSGKLLGQGSGQLDLTTDKMVFRKDNP